MVAPPALSPALCQRKQTLPTRLATVLLAAALWALAASARASGASSGDDPYHSLRRAIDAANSHAKSCKQHGTCLSAPVTLNLTQDVSLWGKLPGLAPHAHLVIKGRCSKQPGREGARKCIIDGQLRHTLFSSATPKGSPSKLVLLNLVIQKARGGVFVNMHASVAATGVTFRHNEGGVDIWRGNTQGGIPPRFFHHCKFLHNSGSVIVAGQPRHGLTSQRGGYYVKRSVFSGNTGDRHGVRGGAVLLFGAGTSVFEDVEFSGNSAEESGGAIYADETKLVLRRVRFVKNTAVKGSGAAVYGVNGPYHAMVARFCSCSFVGNQATTNPRSGTLSFTPSRPEQMVPLNPFNLTFCNTLIPTASLIAPEPYGFVQDFQGSACHRTHC